VTNGNTPLTDDDNVRLYVIEEPPSPEDEPLTEEGMTTEEAYAFLGGRTDVLTAALDAAKMGAMIALVPDEASRRLLHMPDDVGVVPEDDLHLTLLFLGEATDWDVVARNDVHDHVRAFLRELPGSMVVTGEAFAAAHFAAPGSDVNDRCWVALVGRCPTVLDVRGHLDEIFLDGDPSRTIPEQRVPFIPHVTLRYSDSDEEAGEVREHLGHVAFDVLRVSFGDDVTDYPLGDPGTLPPGAPEGGGENSLA
jgi:2'-5' RNA ligase